MKRVINLLLALVLLLTLGALATPAQATELVDSGTCGENLTWTLDSDGVLTISGTGDMWDYFDDDPGWIGYCEELRAVVIESGVTSIGDFAFYECSNVEAVTIHSSVSRIGRSAFDGCSLTELTIPASVAVIDRCAFRFCCDLTEIHFMGQAPSIAFNAFEGVTAAAYYPFGPTWNLDTLWGYGGALTWIVVGDDQDPWTVTGQCGDDVYWSLNSDGLLAITGTGDMWDYSDDDPGWIDHCEELRAVVIESGVTSIGEFAFYDCPNVEEVTIPNSVSRIGRSVFDGCSLTELTIPASVAVIEQYAFSRCSYLTEIHFMGQAPNIAFNAFEGVTAAAYYPFGPTWNLDTLGGYGGALTWIVVGDDQDPWTVTGQCGDDVYWSLNSDGLLAITGTGAMWDYPEEYPGWYTYRDILTKAVIHAGVTAIGDFAFYECSNVEEVTIHSSVSRIGESAFYGCNLTELTIPSGVKEIGGGAFRANLMTSVTIPASVEIIGGCAFAACDLTEIRFMGAAPTIADDAFEGVTAACYYPSGSRWSDDILRNYGGRLTWIADGEEETPDDVVAGDVDGSGTVDSDDAIYLLYYTLFGDGLYPVNQPCDFNGDGSVNADDAIYLLYFTLFGDAMYPLK